MKRCATVSAVQLILAAAMAGTQAHAQTIRYQVQGQSEQSANTGAELTINVGTVNGTVLVRVWDPDPDAVSGLANDDAGKITINGTLGTNGQLQILVAGDNWPVFATTQLLIPGLRNLGLYDVGDPNNDPDGIVVTDPDLRAHTRLAAFTSDDIRGDITVGQVQRIQAGFRPPGGDPNPGIISANISTIAVDNAFAANEAAIGYISAGNGITGNITAIGAHDEGTGLTTAIASIGRVVVGPNDSSVGIRGNIIAEDGHIGAIYTTGPIGEENARAVSIVAGDGIA